MSRRYSLQPLADALGVESAREIADAIGVTVRTVARWKVDGVPAASALEAADAIREHRYALWPEMADHDIAGMTRTCAARGCEEPFVLSLHGGPNRLYCSETCASRVQQRRRRQKPDAREAMRRLNAAWEEANRDGRNRARRVKYRQSPEEKRAASRAYYAANREKVRARQQEARRLHRQQLQEEEAQGLDPLQGRPSASGITRSKAA